MTFRIRHHGELNLHQAQRNQEDLCLPNTFL